MGCATSLCGCTQTAVATVTPRALSHVTVNPHGPGTHQRRSAGSTKSRLSRPSIVGSDKNSSMWSTYDVEIRDIDEFSEADLIRGPCEIESDDETTADQQRMLLDHFNNNKSQHTSNHTTGSSNGGVGGAPAQYTNGMGMYHQLGGAGGYLPRHPSGSLNSHPGNLLSENSKWTVTVRLYTQKAADQRSNDIPSVEETGSHYSSGEWPGKSESSGGSRGSGKRVQPAPAVLNPPNGLIVSGSSSKGAQSSSSSSHDKAPQQQREQHKVQKQQSPVEKYSNKHQATAVNSGPRLNRLHHSHSERPMTKEELALHERAAEQAALNPTYAWGRGHQQPLSGGETPREPKVTNGRGLSNGLIFNGVNSTPLQKYEHRGSLSTYLSLGTNHYRTNKNSFRDSKRQQNPESEETWQSLCDQNLPSVARPRSSHHSSFRGVNDIYPHSRRARSPSPIDSLITDYLVDTDIMEDFSGSTHSLTNMTPVKPSSGSSSSRASTTKGSGKNGEKSVTIVDDRPQATTKGTVRPRAALRRHRSEPFHFLV